MSKNKGKTKWRPMPHRIGAREWLVALAVIAGIAALTFAAVYWLPKPGPVQLPVVINRVMTSNPSACFSVEGNYYDWIELKNLDAGQSVNLKDWRLTDTGDLRAAYVFGDLSLAPGGTLRVYCDEAPEGYGGDALFTGFRLSSDGELLMLADPRQRMTTLSVPALRKTDIYQRDPQTGRYYSVSFHEALESEAEYTSTLTPAFDPNGMIISEVMPVNRSTLKDEDGDTSDWIELYNATGAAFDLTDCALSDDDANRRKWIFPECALQPGEYLIVFASGKDRRDPAGQLHTGSAALMVCFS